MVSQQKGQTDVLRVNSKRLEQLRGDPASFL